MNDSESNSISFIRTFSTNTSQSCQVSEMFKLTAIVFFAAAAVCFVAAKPADPAKAPPATIVSQTQSLDASGTYAFQYETSDGTKQDQAGVLKDIQNEGAEPGKGISMTGSYTFVGDDGQTYTVTYIADENGFQPSGAHLPTPPPPAK